MTRHHYSYCSSSSLTHHYGRLCPPHKTSNSSFISSKVVYNRLFKSSKSLAPQLLNPFWHNTINMSSEKPTDEQIEDAILSARFGDLDDLKTFVDAFGKEALAEARDERGNTVLHMCCGNGHLGMSILLL